MNKELEKRKKMLELSRVKLGREELELKIIEREDEVARLKLAIEKQVEKELELEADIAKLV
jgi:hypothetical protein